MLDLVKHSRCLLLDFDYSDIQDAGLSGLFFGSEVGGAGHRRDRGWVHVHLRPRGVLPGRFWADFDCKTLLKPYQNLIKTLLKPS